MKKIIALLGPCILSLAQGCTSDQDPAIPCIEQPEPSVSHCVMKFEGSLYETDVIGQGDTIKFLDPEYENVYRTRILPNPNISAIISKGEAGYMYIEYFLTEKELLGKYDFRHMETNAAEPSIASSRSGTIDLYPMDNTYPIIAYAQLYDDKNFDDTRLISYATTAWTTYVSRLKDFGFNDKTSSIKVFNLMDADRNYDMRCLEGPSFQPTVNYQTYKGSQLRPVLKCYKDSYYEGSVIYCIASPSGSGADHLDYDLKKIGWNDKISSIGWVIVTDFSVFHGEDPAIPAHGDC